MYFIIHTRTLLLFFKKLSICFISFLCSMRDFSSQTRDGTQASCLGSMESKPWDHQENPQNTTLYMDYQRKRDLVGIKKIINSSIFPDFLLTLFKPK